MNHSRLRASLPSRGVFDRGFRLLLLSALLALYPGLSIAVPDHASQTHQDVLVKSGGDHPRLYLSVDKLEHIRARLVEYPYSKFLLHTRYKADKFVMMTPPATVDRGKDIRGFGELLPGMALTYLLTDKERYLQGTIKWMDALVEYPDWGGNEDLDAAHLLFGMSVGYDWIFPHLDIERRIKYRNKISKQANILFSLLKERKKWWTRTRLENHAYTGAMALAVASIALRDEVPEARSWSVEADRKFSEILPLLSPDGAWHEGLNYWSYSMDALLRYYLARPSGRDELKASPFFRNAARFRLHASLPGFKENVDYADSPTFEWSGPGHILRALASVFRDGQAQWLAERIEKARGRDVKVSWFDFVSYDESVIPRATDDLPTHAYFDNLGILISRSSWADDASWVMFKAGQPQGRLAFQKGEYRGLGHVHPDEGHFSAWANGAWAIIDDGYVFRKRTENHNVLRFNDLGQIGEGGKWFMAERPTERKRPVEITGTVLRPDYQYVEADLTPIYPVETGLKKWLRTFIVIGGGQIIVRDEFELDKPGKVESLVHLASSATQGKDQAVCLGKFGRLYGVTESETLPKLVPYHIPQEERGAYGKFNGQLLSITDDGVLRGESGFFIALDEKCNGDATYRAVAENLSTMSIFKRGKRYVTVDFGRKTITTH